MADDAKGNDTDAETGDSIDKVREILFGAQQRQADQRFGKLEQYIDREMKAADERLAEARRGIDRRIEEMETKLVNQLTKLSERMEDSLASFRKEADQGQKHLADTLSTAQRSLREEIEAQGKQTQAKLSELKADLDTTATDLDGDKASRDELGGYLMELGMRLSGDAGNPKAGKAGKTDGQPNKK